VIDYFSISVILCSLAITVLIYPVDVAAASARNIQVSHTPGAVDDATATVGAFLTISCLRNFSLAERNGREGKWKSGWEPARDPEGRTVGIIGMGGIGQVSLFSLRPCYTWQWAGIATGRD
jgi:lactate dehydrogenase-like 2-hydroxyacid dehydrogenase